MALERWAVLRRAIFNETNQLPTCTREIKKPTDIQRLTVGISEDALPSSRKKPATFTLQCAWAESNRYCSRPDRLRTHVLTHVGFKPSPATETEAIPTGGFVLIDRGDSRSFIQRNFTARLRSTPRRLQLLRVVTYRLHLIFIFPVSYVSDTWTICHRSRTDQ